jgi:hypothetical protein
MERDYWLRQTADKPLFPELAWSRPENRQQAGKLLIVGGSLHGFAAPAEAYATAVKAGIGTGRVLLPDAVRKVVGRFLENGEFAPSTPSGSFSQKALDELLLQSSWADAVLFAGDLGRNSETAILLEKFLAKSPLPITLTKDAVDYVVSAPQTIVQRPNTLLVLSLSQLQRLGTATKTPKPITFGMDLLHLVEWLHQFTLAHQPHIIVKHLNHILMATDGRVSSTTLAQDKPIWRIQTAAKASVWWLQNPSKILESVTASLIN